MLVLLRAGVGSQVGGRQLSPPDRPPFFDCQSRHAGGGRRISLLGWAFVAGRWSLVVGRANHHLKQELGEKWAISHTDQPARFMMPTGLARSRGNPRADDSQSASLVDDLSGAYTVSQVLCVVNQRRETFGELGGS